MLDTHYRRYMKPSRMTADRSSMVARQTAELGRAQRDLTLQRLSEELGSKATAAADREDERRLQREARGGDEDNPFDDVADAAVHQLFDDMTGVIKYFTAVRDPRLPRLKLLAERHFTTGVGYVTAARYETQLLRMERLVADLRGPSANLVEGLGWGAKVQAIEDAIGPYRVATAARDRVTGGDVRAAQDEMHLASCRLLAYVLWAYADRPEARGRILAPIDDQQDRIAAIMRARRSGRSGPIDEAAVADEAEALEAPGAGLSPEELAQAEADAARQAADDGAPPRVDGQVDRVEVERPDVERAEPGPAEGPFDGPVGGAPVELSDRGGESAGPR